MTHKIKHFEAALKIQGMIIIGLVITMGYHLTYSEADAKTKKPKVQDLLVVKKLVAEEVLVGHLSKKRT